MTIENYKYPQFLAFLDERQQNLVKCARRQMKCNYGFSVDYQLYKEGVLLTKESASYLYCDFTPAQTSYQKGARPELEAFVEACTKDCRTTEETVLSLMRAVRDLYLKFDGQLLFYGGTEEELIHKGEQLCECLARLMVALCEIKGIAGRIIAHVGGGHFTTEIRINGKYAYIDPRAGLYFRKSNGELASFMDILEDKSILYSQEDSVKSDLSKRWTYEQRIQSMERFTHDREINYMENYSLSKQSEYSYYWLTNKDIDKNGIIEAHDAYLKAIRENFDTGETIDPPTFYAVIQPEEAEKNRFQLMIFQKNCCVFPSNFRIFLDDQLFMETDLCIAPKMVHTYLSGMAVLNLDLNHLPSGTHKMTIQTPSIKNFVFECDVCIPSRQ